MKLHTFSGLVLAAALTSTLSPRVLAQNSDSGTKSSMKSAGTETKDAAKDVGHGVKQGTKKAYHKTKHVSKKAVHKVEGKRDTTANNPSH